MASRSPARLITDVLNPFVVFTALFVAVAFAESPVLRAALYTGVELLAAAVVAGFVLLMRRRSRVGDFWISIRAERLIPAIFLLTTFVVLLITLSLLGAPTDLFLLTLSMGLASATVALITLFFKASAHCAVAGHAAAAGVILLDSPGLVFLPVLPLVAWARVSLEAHTVTEALAGAVVGVAFAVLFLV